MKKLIAVLWLWYFFVVPKPIGMTNSAGGIGLPMLVETMNYARCEEVRGDLMSKGFSTTLCRELGAAEKIWIKGGRR